MFKSKQQSTQPQYEKFDTLIGRTTIVEGVIKTEEPLRIDGKVQGEVNSKADLIIGEKSYITGDVSCQNVMLAGTVQGNITAKGQLHITASGRLHGDASIGSFIVDERGVFDGKCTMVQSQEDESGVLIAEDNGSDQGNHQRGNRRKK